ncbi:hypothetical protein [Hippea alviniae]|uniref:hypothetical protein n=1 Tax=Hippea alviniae TaxID=1279027 RepID=UPI00138AFE64|nr:hypothetical protein [Hippea alviniae]
MLSACTIFKPLPEKEYLINGTFDANFEGRTFEGFFSLNGSNLRLDVINSLGFSVAGIYVSGDTVLVKDYQTGREYKNLKIGDIDLNQYKSLIIYITKNFTELCSKRNGNVVVLRCKKINNTNLPVDFVLVDKSKRLRIGLSKIKMLLKESKP